MMRKAIRNMIGRIRFQRAAAILPALLLITAGMSSCSENEDVNDVPVPTAKGTGVEFSLGMAGWNESGAAPRRAHAAAAQAQDAAAAETMTAELAPGISASVCMTQEYATGKASGPRRAAATKTLTAGTYTIIAYQGTAEQHTEKARMTADWDGAAFTLHGSGGKKAYMELEPGDYTFVCFNDRLEEKDGALVIAKDGTTPTSDDYAQALAGTAAATVSDKSTKVSLVLSHPFARVTFRIVGNGLDVTAKDYDYSDVQNPKEISYTTKIGTNAYLSSATETLDLQRLNPVSLLPEKADASAHTADGASGKRPLSFGAIATGATADAPAAWLKQFQYAQSNTLYFPAGTSLRNYDVTEDGGTATMIYGKTVSLADLFSTAMPDGTLQANTSYTVLIYVSYNFRYLFNDGTVGTLADNWNKKAPIAIVTSMKNKTAMALNDAGSAAWSTRNDKPFNKKTFNSYGKAQMFQDPYGYEYTWDPAFSEDGTTVKAASDDFPAFKMAANYTPGVELTADWLKNPSTALSVREGKWYLPSYGEVRTAYQSILRGTFARINGSEIIQEKEFDINKDYMYMENFIRIGILQAGGNSLSKSYWNSTEGRFGSTAYYGNTTIRNGRLSPSTHDNITTGGYHKIAVRPFIHFK